LIAIFKKSELKYRVFKLFSRIRFAGILPRWMGKARGRGKNRPPPLQTANTGCSYQWKKRSQAC